MVPSRLESDKNAVFRGRLLKAMFASQGGDEERDA